MKITIENLILKFRKEFKTSSSSAFILEHEMGIGDHLIVTIGGIEYSIDEEDGNLKLHCDGQISIIPHAANSITIVPRR